MMKNIFRPEDPVSTIAQAGTVRAEKERRRATGRGAGGGRFVPPSARASVRDRGRRRASFPWGVLRDLE
jgi:hypothetical protein